MKDLVNEKKTLILKELKKEYSDEELVLELLSRNLACNQIILEKLQYFLGR